MKCVVVYPSLKLSLERYFSEELIKKLDVRCSRSGKAVYIHGKKTTDILALMIGEPDADHSACAVENITLDQTSILVGIADDTGDNLCALSAGDLDIKWLSEGQARENIAADNKNKTQTSLMETTKRNIRPKRKRG